MTAQLPSVIVPAGAVDAQSLIALADLVVSAGGTMNREAVALGTPVYSTFGGPPRRRRRAPHPRGPPAHAGRRREIELVKQRGERHIARRDPAVLADIILGAGG